jgi:hypothetical protein
MLQPIQPTQLRLLRCRSWCIIGSRSCQPESDNQDVRSFCALGIGEGSSEATRHAPQILGIATCARLRRRRRFRRHWCCREPGAADRMGRRCRDCRAVVRRAGLAMAAFARARPGGDTRGRRASILAAGGWRNCGPGHASAADWAALRGAAREYSSGVCVPWQWSARPPRVPQVPEGRLWPARIHDDSAVRIIRARSELR